MLKHPRTTLGIEGAIESSTTIMVLAVRNAIKATKSPLLLRGEVIRD
jgi:hypothetical protein